jgi:microcystin degradation protein MlrC
MRIAIGQLWQETNTFNPRPTTRADFEQFGILRGPDLVARMADTNEPGGFIQSLRAWPEKPEIVGLVRLPAWPSGAATFDTFEWLRDELLGALEAALPVDAVLLALHGSLVAEGAPDPAAGGPVEQGPEVFGRALCERARADPPVEQGPGVFAGGLRGRGVKRERCGRIDVEGAVLQRVREAVGPGVPVVATLDLHANITDKMVSAADALVLYHTAPHVDVFETGQRGATVLRRILVEGARPATAFQKVPMVVPAERANTQNPDSVSFAFRQRLQKLEADPRVLAAGLATVQPWLDIPDLGSAVLVVTDGNPELARDECSRLAADLWARRMDYLPELTPVEEAVKEAHRFQEEGLVVLSDSADATTSGAPGDSNHVLRELLKYDWPRGALVTLVDPDLVAQATQAGLNAEFNALLGGKRDHRFSRPMPVDVRVESVFEARFVMSGHLARNMAIDMGPSVVLRSGDVRIVVTSRSGPHFAPELFRVAGLDPFAAGALVAKSPCGFRAAYQDRAARIILVQAPGCAPADFWHYEYRNIPHPLWPWDESAVWAPH